MKYALLLTAVVGLMSAKSETAHAATDAKTAEASSHFQKGVQLYRQRSFDSALAEFEKSYDLAPDYHLLFNLAQVQLERHDYVAALKRFREYLQLGDTQIEANRRAEVEQEMVKLKEQIAELNFAITPEGAEVSIDGLSVGSAPLNAPIPINSGVHRLQVSKPGFKTEQQALTVAGGEAPHVVVALRPSEQAAPSTPGPAEEAASATSRTSRRPAGENRDAGGAHPATNHTGLWISLGTTVALGGASGAMALVTNSAKRRFDSQLDTFGTSRAQIDSTRSELKTKALITDVLLGAAVVGAGFCVYFLATDSPPSEEAAPRRLGFGIAPRGVFASGEF